MTTRTATVATLCLLAAGAASLAAQVPARPRAAGIPAARTSPAPRERISIDDGWRFHKGDPPGDSIRLQYDSIKPWILRTGNPFIRDPARRFGRPPGSRRGDVAYARPDFDDRSWRRVDLPHDWGIEGPWLTTGDVGGMGRLPSWGVAWYRRKLDIPAGDAGRSIFLDVDGAMSCAAVWLNGRLVGGWPYGYASWRVDLTPYVTPGGANQLAIRLDNPPASSRWYPGGGIYRNVWLTKTSAVHVAHWGTSVTTPRATPASATIELQVTIDNGSHAAASVRVGTAIYALDAHGRRAGAAAASIAPVAATLAAGASATVTGSVILLRPRLWGPPPRQRPNRYLAVTTVWQQGKVVDVYETRFGIRSLHFDPDSGVFVNGQHVRIQGVNDHHDLGALGAAFNYRAAERQLDVLREMGANALRTSHDPPAPELLELADSMGFLVLDEAFDVWARPKTPFDYHLLFPAWHEQDLRALVRHDRNHPSVFLWSIGNEVGEQYTAEEGAALAKRLVDIVHEEDPTRPVTSAMNYAAPDMPLPAALDVIGLNYQGEGIREAPEFEGTDRIRRPPQYPAFHAAFPRKLILSTETASAFGSRGVYLFPVTTDVSSPVRDGRGGDSRIHQVSAYDLYAVDFGSSPDKVFRSLDEHPYVAGEFVWTGRDYLGEPTPYYAARSSYSGIIDLAGFPKDAFFLYQSRWRPDLPMAHILPHWTWPERVGQVTPVHVFTSGDEAELFLDGHSLGRKKKAPFEYRLRWDSVRYRPGKLVAVAYRNGARWATDSVETAGAPAVLRATPDRPRIRADGRDLAFVTVRVLDAHGRLAPRADNPIHFAIDGPGEIVASDNGDPTSFEPFQARERRLFNGLCLVILRARPGQVGRITLTGSSDGLRTAVAVMTASR